MSKLIFVPTHLNAIFLNNQELMVSEMADFDRLPFTSTEKDSNPDVPNISEAILSEPFQNNNLTLNKGLHLHWSLPDALTKGSAGGTESDFPAVPNRWYVKRTSAIVGDKAWIVESDYLHADIYNLYDGVVYPVEASSPSDRPFRYLGRRLDAGGWAEDATAERLPRLTAMGYGEPAFASFYPNCHSVFGCFDEDIDEQDKLNGLRYQLIGWYSPGSEDPIAKLVADHPGDTPEVLQQRINELYRWEVALSGHKPNGLCCYADLEFNANTDVSNIRKNTAATISIGNTGVEALSAWMGDKIADADKIKLEEQLENLLAQAGLQSKTLDMSARLKEACHENRFVAESGGSLWDIRSLSDQNNVGTLANITLPPGMGDTLDELSTTQQQLDQAIEKLEDRRQSLFADWYKYILSTYPPNDAMEDYPDVDFVKFYIQTQQLPRIGEMINTINDKGTEVTDKKTLLDQQIADFNTGTVAKAGLSKLLHKSGANTSGLTLHGTTSWIDNTPFSEACLEFNGTDAYIVMAGSGTIKALSLWVNMAVQTNSEAVLLATQNEGALIAKTEIHSFWSRFVLNGKDQPAYRPLSWNALPKDQWVYLYVEFDQPLQSGDTLYLFSDVGGTQFVKGKLAAVRTFDDALTDDELYIDQNMLQHRQYELVTTSAPRFWRPSEPVVLLEGEAIKPTERYGEDGRLSENNTLGCDLADVINYPLTLIDAIALLTRIDSLKPPVGNEKAGFHTWTTQPWEPFLLEWEVQVFPMQEGGNINTEGRNFHQDFVNHNFELPPDEPWLNDRSGKPTVAAATLFRGRTILSSSSKKQLVSFIARYLDNLKQDDCYQVIGTIPKADEVTYRGNLETWYAAKPVLAERYLTNAEFDAAITAYKTWYEGKPVYDGSPDIFGNLTISDRLEDFNYAMIIAYEKAISTHFISQALSGFNETLLMQGQTLQLPVTDPLGFDEYRTFAAEVRAAIAGHSNVAAVPLSDFLPFRSGMMKMHQFRIVDTFGQAREVNIENVIKSETVDSPLTAGTDHVWLAPCFVQPVRINFRWFSALTGTRELNAHPDNTPVCGWLLANHLDSSLGVYNRDGFPIGIIDRQARWRNFPGSDTVVNPADIDNPYLRKVVERLALTGNESDPGDIKKTFLQDFITIADRALTSIDPESFTHHRKMALLIGRPLAVVRATINLELKGEPAIDHGWNSFRLDMERNYRETDRFEHVKIPIRIGERHQFNDGLLGYWKEDATGMLSGGLYISAQEIVSNGNIYSYEEAPLNINHSLSDSPQTLTMIMDPRGEVHATTGILPAKSISIPEEQYAPALERLEIPIMAAPVLTDKSRIALPLPGELEFEWSWLARDHFRWTEISRRGTLRRDLLLDTFQEGGDLWQQLLDKGWIIPIDSNCAYIASVEKRIVQDLEPPFLQIADQVQAVLEAGHIMPVSTDATFSEKQVIREGWLKLST